MSNRKKSDNPAAKGEGGRRLTKERVVAWLRRRFMLRLHMTWIVGGTFLAGIIATRLLDDVGFHSMPWRYLTAVVLAYLVFLMLIRIWLWYVGVMSRRNEEPVSSDRRDPDPYADRNPDLDLDFGAESVDFCADMISTLRPGFFDAPALADGPQMGGGGFGGGGSTGSWGDPDVAQPVVAAPSGGGGGGFGIDLDLDGEGLAIVLLAAAVVLALFVAAIYVVYAAPAILGEAAFEAALAAALARSAKRVDTPGWVGRVWRATVLPFAVVAVLTVALGWYAQRHCPSAHRLADAIDCAQPRRQ